MEKEFIQYQEALELKELGFDEPCLAMFTNRYTNGETYPKAIGQHEGSNISGDKNSDFDGQSFWYVTAPTFSQAFRWFREKYNIDSFVKHLYKSTIKVGYYFGIDQYKGVAFQTDFDAWYQTYEEAELQCLQHLIKIVKEQQK